MPGANGRRKAGQKAAETRRRNAEARLRQQRGGAAGGTRSRGRASEGNEEMDTDEEENDLPEQQQPGPSGRRRQRDSPPEDELSIDEINRQIALDTLRHQREMHELERRRAQRDTQPAGGTGTSQDVLEEDEFGESSLTPAERQHLTLFPRVDKKHIISIVKHKFHANNLVYLDRQAAAEAEPEMSITLSNGAWKQKKVVGKLSDFGPTSEIWSRNFLVFVQILQAFFGTTHPTLSI